MTFSALRPPPGGRSHSLVPRALPPEPDRLTRVGRGLLGCGLLMVPWLFVLGSRLPSTTEVDHWATAWVGLDTLEAVGLATTGVLLCRRDERCRLAAAASATLLVVDAWFDVTTAHAGAERALALGMAAFLELPLAALCTVLAVALPPSGPTSAGGGDQGQPAPGTSTRVEST